MSTLACKSLVKVEVTTTTIGVTVAEDIIEEADISNRLVMTTDQVIKKIYVIKQNCVRMVNSHDLHWFFFLSSYI